MHLRKCVHKFTGKLLVIFWIQSLGGIGILGTSKPHISRGTEPIVTPGAGSWLLIFHPHAGSREIKSSFLPEFRVPCVVDLIS